ncbi:internalin, putative [hydrothermal vent metagenome]|uniref:Internalin, putative n=1 Tax=hydrothermal vent metagenome TaxID=652676 RepID=A0A3B0WQP2_9ZZZZ
MFIARFVFLLMLGASFTASASHFRGGSITWQSVALDGDGLVNDVQITVKTACALTRTCTPNSLSSSPFLTLTAGSVTTTTLSDYVLEEVVFTAKNLSPTQIYDIFYDSCCRISTLQNNANGNWKIQTQVSLKDGNLAPKIDLPILYEVPMLESDGVTVLNSFSFDVGATDPNADKVRFRLANLDELGGGSQVNPTGFAINSNTGKVTWTNSGTLTPGLYSAGIVVEDVDVNGNAISKSHIDFLLNLINKPSVAFVPDVNLPESRNVIVEKGNAFTFTITGAAVDVSSLGDVQGALTEPSEGNFVFAPGAIGAGLNPGVYPITFEVLDTTGNATKSYLILNFIVPDPRSPEILNIEGDTTIYSSTVSQIVDLGVDALVSDQDAGGTPVNHLNNGFLRFNVTFTDGQFEILGVASVGDGVGEIRRTALELFYEGVKIGDIDAFEDGVGRALRVDFANVSLAAVQALVRSLTYEDTFLLRSNGQRSLSLFVQDEDGLNRNYSVFVDVQDHPDKPAGGGPVEVNNNLALQNGSTVILSTENLTYVDADSVAADLTITVSGVAQGQFELVTAPGVAITSFTQEQIDQGQVQFVHNNSGTPPVYSVTVSDGVTSDGPNAAAISFTGASADFISLVENRIGVTILSASNVVGTPSYAITGSAVDNSLFTVNPVSGSLAFIAAPDFETPTDANNDNVYIAEVTVTGSTSGTDVRTITVSLLDVNEAPTINGAPASSVNNDIAYSFVPTGFDPENATLNYSITNKPAWASFSTVNGALTGTPGYNDVGLYSNIIISVSDGSSVDTLTAFSITVLADLDNDGQLDSVDLDDDNDGIPDSLEGNGLVDTDNDSLVDSLDLDSDGDGISDLVEAGGNDVDSNGLVDGFTDLNNDGYDDGLAASPLPVTDSNNDGTPDYLDNTDTDGDGVMDTVDLDDDNDGIPDGLEGSGSVDSDGDGIADSLDLDSDNDGLFDLNESGIPTVTALDSNNDGRVDLSNAVGSNGLADTLETGVDSGVTNYNGGVLLDTDGDGVANFRDLDSDGDGLYDLLEAGGTDSDSNGQVDGFADIDGDGFDDGTASTPLATPDSDGDGVVDSLDLDSDNDGVMDVTESGGDDSNGDGLIGPAPQLVNVNGVYVGGVLIPLDTDSDGVLNQLDLDSDNDGVPDVVEAGGIDGDGDGVVGTGEPTVNTQGIANNTILNPADTDNDGSIDPQDLDSDSDGILDLVEAGGSDNNDDGLVDGFTDSDGDGFDDAIAATSLPLPDGDGDGIADFQDNDDTDNDGVVDSLDIDDDNDGIPDSLEGDGVTDTDGDGIVDSRDLDSDNDGLFDLTESGVSNPATLDTDNDGRIDNSNNIGSNGLADIVETTADSGSVNYNGGTVIDTDFDGVADFRDLDSDNDIIPDVVENGGNDADGDGVSGSGVPSVNVNGLVSGSGLPVIDSDNDGTPNYLDLDSDGDGAFDLIEAGSDDTDSNGLVDNFIDTNGDGFDDTAALEVLLLADADNDGIFDYLDINDDSVSDENTNDVVAGGGDVRTGVDGIGQLNFWLLLMFLSLLILARCRPKAVLLLVLAAMPLSSNAETEGNSADDDEFLRRIYIGAGIGQSLMAPETSGTTFSVDDDRDSGYKLYLGIDLSESFSAELSMADLGTTTLSPTGEIDYQLFSLDALYYFYDQDKNDHEGWASYIKAGLATINNSATNVPFVKENSVQLALGLGVEYGWKNGLAARVDLESFDEDAALLTVGLLYRFGKEDKKSPRKAIAYKDTDGDGVFDNQDKCPKTPTQSSVDNKGCELDSDKDGVVDSKDQCPSSAPGSKVDAIGCNKDKDGDGVLNELDQCPNTIKGASVNKVGCAIFEAKIEGINFKPGSADLEENSKVVLDTAAEALLKFTTVRIEVQAHTDSQGRQAVNQKLSEARAKSVVDYLESKGVSRGRMQAKGYGEKQPLANNKTAEGRALNRRVEFRVLDAD